MATKNANEEKEVKAVKAAPKAKAPKAAKPKAAPKPKAEPKPAAPQLSKDDVQAAVYAAVKAAVLETRASAPQTEIKVEMPKKEVKQIKCTSDERLLSALAIIYLVFGLLASVALIATGIALEVQEDSFLAQYVDGPDMGISLIVGGVAILLPTLVQYACMRLFANISHRLTSLDEK